MKRIAVIIPLVDWTEYVLGAIKSALYQRGEYLSSQSVECIVVANNAEDASRLLSEFPNHSLTVVLERRFGCFAEGFNIGLSHASSEYVIKLSPENLLLDGWLEAASVMLATAPTARLFFGAGFEVDQNDYPFKERNPRRPTVRNLCSRISLVADAVIYERQLFREFGRFHESYRWRSEFEFALRLAKAGVPTAEIKFKMVGIRVMYVRRRATAQEMGHELAATNEAIDILKTHDMKTGDRWLLYRAAIEADLAGHTRLSSISFDRHVIKGALHHRLSVGSPTTLSALSATVNLALEHARIESNHLLKRPRLAARFLRIKDSIPPNTADSTSRPIPFERPSRRIFQLRYDDPQPLMIPSNYLARRSESPTLSLSIVTPNLNQGVFIERTITSVLDQEIQNLEYVIQDGCSKDMSLQVIKKYETKLSNWQSVKDRGQSHAINMGLKNTSGDIMAYLNSDDILLPGSLEYVVRYFEQHPETDVVYGDRLLIDEEDRVINYWVLPEHDSGAIAWADFIPQETMFWRRSAWNSIGAHVDESFHFAMDWDMILRFRSHGRLFVHLPRFLGAFRITESQKTNQLQASVGLQDMNRLRKRELGYVPSDIEIGQRMKHYVQRQKKAERRYQIASSISKFLRGMQAWTPSRSDLHQTDTTRAA